MKTTSLFLSAFACALAATQALSAEAIRDYYDEPGINPFKNADSEAFSETIDTFSGMLQIGVTDLRIPGNGGFDIEIRRNYATPFVTNEERSPYGYGWTMHFGRIVVPTADASKVCSQHLYATSVTDNPSIELPDGSRKLLVLADNHDPMLITKDWWAADCVAGDVIVKSPEGVEYHMTYDVTAGDVTSIYATYIEDANGNSMTIDYQTNPAGRTYIDGLTTSDGRSVSFQYADISNGDIRLSEITANGQTWTYDYTFPSGLLQPPPQLRRINRPDGNDWQFDYNPYYTSDEAGSLAIAKVTTPMGGTLDYTYDFVFFAYGEPTRTTVVASKTTGGRDVNSGTWSYLYTPGYQSNSGYDETIIYQPSGIRKDYHYGYSSVGAGQVWRTGLKAYEEFYNDSAAIQEQKSFTYQPLIISDENFWHGRDTSRIDSYTYVPVLEEVYHYREGRGVTTTYSNFNSYGQPETVTETSTAVNHSDRVTTFTYINNVAAWILGLVEIETVTNPTNAPVGNWTIIRGYDGAGNMLSENQYGVETTYTYTPEGDIATVTDANGKTTTFSDYHRGIARYEVQPEGVTLARTVNNSGTLASETNGLGYTTSYTWDELNRLTGITYPVNDPVSIAYAANQRTLTRGSYQETVTWDGFGRERDVNRTDTTTQESLLITRTRDESGRLAFESYPNSADGVSITYDEFGRKLTESHSNGDSVAYDYPTASEVVITDTNGNVTTRTYSHYGTLNEDSAWLASVDSPENVTTLFARDGLGQLWRVFQGEIQPDDTVMGHGRIYNRNTKNFLETEEHPETGVTSYTYDGVGNVLSRTVGSGVTESFAWDGRNRLAAKTYSDATPAVVYAYDKADNLLSVDNGQAYREYEYDANNNLTREWLTVGGHTYDLAYAVGALDFTESLTYPSGRTVTYNPDALGRQLTALPYVTAVHYHPNGVPQATTLANGATTVVNLDSRLRPSEITTTSGTTAIVDLTLGFDNSYNVTSVTDNVSGMHTRTLSYDGMDRLVSAVGSWGTEAITYGGTGNIYIRDRNGTVQEYLYNNMKLGYRLFPTHYLEVTHDARGNMTSDGVHQFSYNAADKLTSATTSNGTIQYGYDGEGIRVSRTVGSDERHYFYSQAGQLIGEYNPAGGFDEYIYVGDRVAAKATEDAAVVGAN